MWGVCVCLCVCVGLRLCGASGCEQPCSGLTPALALLQDAWVGFGVSFSLCPVPLRFLRALLPQPAQNQGQEGVGCCRRGSAAPPRGCKAEI